MPWHVEHRDDEWCVIKDADGSTEKCHPTREQANRHMAALYAAEPDARSSDVEMRASCSSYFSRALNSENPASALKSICALDRGASITALSERFGLPHHATPGGPPDRACVAAALAAIGGARQGSPMSGPGVDAAKAHLTRHKGELNMGERTGTMEGVEIRSSTITDVDTRQRLIDLVAVPWEEEGEVMWKGESWREVFVRGAFDGIEDHAGRVPVNHEHVRGQTVGKVVKFTNADPGLLGRVKVGKTPLGDDILNLADEDMVSASVGFRIGKPSDVQIHRASRLRRVMKAFIDHLAMTESPVYAGARVLAVRAEPSGVQVVEQDPLISTPALDEFRDDEVFAWARQRLEGR
jgi:HK97 family phage prohead protease